MDRSKGATPVVQDEELREADVPMARIVAYSAVLTGVALLIGIILNLLAKVL